MSAIVAPPVASAGEPKNPVRNLNASNMPKFTDNAVGICNRTKITVLDISLVYQWLGVVGVKHTQSPNIHPQPPNLRNLAHRRPNNRAQSIPRNIQRQAQRGRHGPDAKDLRHVHEPGRVDGGPDVHGESQEADFERDKEFLGAGPISWILCAY
jgi:hypothetical protein